MQLMTVLGVGAAAVAILTLFLMFLVGPRPAAVLRGG